MNKYDKRIKILSILIVIIIIFMIILTFIYFNINKSNNNIDNNLEIKYSNTSNIAIVNINKNEEISKSFSVKNTDNHDVFYDIKFDNIINNFKEGELSYNIIGSENAAYVSDVDLFNSDGIIASGIKLKANEEHNYVLKLTTNTSTFDKKTFSSNIKVSSSNKNIVYEKNTLGYKLLNDNKILSENNIINDGSEGLFYTNNSDDGVTIYFFRGSNILNNNVKLDNNCYKIIRTTENGGIRLIYNGEYINDSCSDENNVIGEVEYNNKSNYNAYVGYMYGTPNSGNYKDEHSNVNSSKIKNYIDSYYSKNLNKYSSIIDNSIYCNDRKTIEFTIDSVKYGENGYKKDNTGYLSMYNVINNKHNYRCNQDNDKLTMPVLSNPVGLITANEVVLAGIGSENNYLNSKNSYWTMSAAYFNGANAYNYIVKDGKLWQNIVSEKSGVRPVITLKSNTTIKEGNGSVENPYVIIY